MDTLCTRVHSRHSGCFSVSVSLHCNRVLWTRPFRFETKKSKRKMLMFHIASDKTVVTRHENNGNQSQTATEDRPRMWLMSVELIISTSPLARCLNFRCQRDDMITVFWQYHSSRSLYKILISTERQAKDKQKTTKE